VNTVFCRKEGCILYLRKYGSLLINKPIHLNLEVRTLPSRGASKDNKLLFEVCGDAADQVRHIVRTKMENVVTLVALPPPFNSSFLKS
jgi:hypothetical protein